MFMAVPLVLASSMSQHFNPDVTKDFGSFGLAIVALLRMPEPRSLFLLGGVLFSLALFVFWKAAKSSNQT